MRKLKLLTIALVTSLMTAQSYALDNKQNYILTLTLINHTSETLSYTGVKATNPGNVFYVSPTEILPGGVATITGTTTEYYDLSGQLRFRNNAGFVSLLRVQNYRNINYDQPKFALQNENYIAYTDSKTYNQDESTRALMSSAATVIIQNKIG